MMPSLMGHVTSCQTRPSAGFNTIYIDDEFSDEEHKVEEDVGGEAEDHTATQVRRMFL